MIILQTASAQNKGGRWQFEQNGYDTATWDDQDDSGELQNGADFDTIDPPEGNSCLFLDTLSENDYFRVNDSNDLDFTNEDIAISAWIYPIVLNDVHFILNKGDQFPQVKTTNYALRISNGDKLEFLIRDANNRAQVVSSSFNIAANVWTFIAVFYDYDAGKVYMWNEPSTPAKDTLDFQQEYFSNDDPLSIGAWYRSDTLDPAIRDFQGRIDDVRISGSPEDVIVTHLSHVKVSNPDFIRLNQNYPNPFNASTEISFHLAFSGHVLLEVFDITGKKIATLIDNTLDKGSHKVNFDAKNLTSGVYFYRIRTREYGAVKKLILVK
jgi:hypothetical protein